MDDYSTKDILAQAFINIDFPAQFVATMHTKNIANIGISDFYTAFCKKNSIDMINGKNVLFQPALILGYLYTSFLLPQQLFFNSIPNDKIQPEEWGVTIEIDNDYSLQHIAKRMRNALGHNHIIITKNMDFTFWDAVPSKKNISEAEAIYKFSFDGLMFKFVKKWNEKIIHIIS